MSKNIYNISIYIKKKFIIYIFVLSIKKTSLYNIKFIMLN